jgi:hypothetical protein
MSRTYACVIARSVDLGEPTVRAVAAPLTLEEALARLARRHPGEIGRVLRLPAPLPELGTVFQASEPPALKGTAFQVKRAVAVQRGALLGRRRAWSGLGLP